jgi:hypothetical protein
MGDLRWPPMAWKSNLIEGKEKKHPGDTVPWILKSLQVLEYLIGIDKYR